MAEPIIVVKENPGKLGVVVFDQDGRKVLNATLPQVPFRHRGRKAKVTKKAKFKGYRNCFVVEFS